MGHSGTQAVAIQPAEEETGQVHGEVFSGQVWKRIHAHTPVAFSGAQSHGLTNLQEGLGNVVSLNAQETDSVTP